MCVCPYTILYMAFSKRKRALARPRFRPEPRFSSSFLTVRNKVCWYVDRDNSQQQPLRAKPSIARPWLWLAWCFGLFFFCVFRCRARPMQQLNGHAYRRASPRRRPAQRPRSRAAPLAMLLPLGSGLRSPASLSKSSQNRVHVGIFCDGKSDDGVHDQSTMRSCVASARSGRSIF